MTVVFKKTTTPDKLADVIRKLGYTVMTIEAPAKSTTEHHKRVLIDAPLPADAPKFFADAFGEARIAKRPIIIDFWAEWCLPCARLKKETLQNEDVKKALVGTTVIYVDLDRHPGLAKAYGVTTIPDVFFVGRDGQIVDRLLQFEPAAPFLKRVEKFNPKEK